MNKTNRVSILYIYIICIYFLVVSVGKCTTVKDIAGVLSQWHTSSKSVFPIDISFGKRHLTPKHRLAGRGCKVLFEYNLNITYISAHVSFGFD
jgi:hypothetical protein